MEQDLPLVFPQGEFYNGYQLWGIWCWSCWLQMARCQGFTKAQPFLPCPSALINTTRQLEVLRKPLGTFPNSIFEAIKVRINKNKWLGLLGYAATLSGHAWALRLCRWPVIRFITPTALRTGGPSSILPYREYSQDENTARSGVNSSVQPRRPHWAQYDKQARGHPLCFVRFFNIDINNK